MSIQRLVLEGDAVEVNAAFSVEGQHLHQIRRVGDIIC